MVNEIKPFGFWTKMNDDDLKEFARRNHNGKSSSEIQREDGGLYTILHKRGLIVKLVEEGIIIRKRNLEHLSRIRNMDEREFISYMENKYREKSLSEIQREDRIAYHRIEELGLQDKFVELGIIKRKGKKRGFFTDMDNNQLIEYTSQNYKGIAIKQMQRANGRLYSILSKRDLIHELVKRGIIITRKRKYGSLINMNNEELINYIESNYSGKRISDFNNKNNRAYELACEKGLIDLLVERKILIREVKRSGFFRNMSDEELIAYTEKNHKGKLMRQAEEDESSVIVIARVRGLMDKIVERGILIREMKKPGFFTNIGDDELVNYIRENHSGKKISNFGKDDAAAYQAVLKRGLVDFLVQESVLIRTRVKNGQWKDEEYMLGRASVIAEKYGIEVFSPNRLSSLKYADLLKAINLYYGGFPAFRDWLREKLQLKAEVSELEDLIGEYISGEGNE